MPEYPPDPQPTPTTPEPLTPAQQRARRIQHNAVIVRGQRQKQLPTPAPAPLPPGRQPAGRRMALEDVTAQRIPVLVSDAARAILDTSSSEARLFPQALAEHFGAVGASAGDGRITRIEIDAVPKSAHFAVAPQEMHPITGAEPQLLIIHAVHADERYNPRRCGADRWLINAADLSALHRETHYVQFQAALTAQELVRLYPHKDKPAPVPAISVVATAAAVESSPPSPTKRTRASKQKKAR